MKIIVKDGVVIAKSQIATVVSNGIQLDNFILGIAVGDNGEFVENIPEIIEVNEVPSDFKPCKYKYNGEFVLNYNYKEPINIETEIKTIKQEVGIPDESTLTETEKRILLASKQCKQRIYSGFESSCLGIPKMFDCQDHDQQTVSGLAITAIMGMQGLTTEETHWKATGELECYKFEYTQILQLAVDMKKHVEANINQFNAERLVILNETV